MYYRIHDTSRSPVESLLSESATSNVWIGVVHRACPECDGNGYTIDLGADGEPEAMDCGACHAGEIAIDSQRGTSVCRSVSDLRAYMAQANARIDADCVLVECEGVEMDEADVDAAAGAVLVQVTRIVSTAPVGADWLAS